MFAMLDKVALKADLLNHYAEDRKHSIAYAQLDGFTDVPPGDCVMVSDEDHDCLMGGAVWELRSGGIPVRVTSDDRAKTLEHMHVITESFQANRRRTFWSCGRWP